MSTFGCEHTLCYRTEKIQPYEELSRLLFEMLEAGAIKGILSVVTVAKDCI